MQLCIKCKKRLAVIFINRNINGKMQNEGYCLECARELNDPNISEILKNFNVPDDALEMLNTPVEDIDGLPDEMEPAESAESAKADPDNVADGRAPFMNLAKLFGNIPGLAFPIGQNPNQQGPQQGRPAQKAETKNPRKKYLNSYCADLTYKAAHGEIDNVIGRDRELERVMQILCRRQKNNPCLIGEPGVGKTAVAEALALKIARGEVPYKLANKEVHLLDMTALVAGTQFRGQFEKRMKDLIEEVKTLGNVILVIDEVHTIASAGDAEGSMNAANILKPALSRGEIQVIGATTMTEYRKYIEKDAALERRFQPVLIDEPSVQNCIEILQGIAGYYEKFHGVKASDYIIRRAVELSERYITDRFLPDKAIDLLDEALSSVSLNSKVLQDYNRKNEELKRISAKRAEQEGITEPEDSEKYFRELAEIKSEELRAKSEVDALRESAEAVELTFKDLADVIEVWTGIPAGNIVEGDFEKIQRLEETIKSRLIGQDQAVDAVVRALKRNRAGVSAKRKPVSFIFAGPTGVGKTELVKQLAEALFDTPETLIRLDMSEYMEKFSVSRIIGSPPGYVGYDEAGQLTEKIRRKPYSVVLFDEIEKAHPDVMNILLQILDEGRITDAQGRTINFENTVIVMTTNAGSSGTSAAVGFGSSAHQQDEQKTEKALSAFLRPEFLNRVDEIITFNRLSKQDFLRIADIQLGDLSKAIGERGVKLYYSDAVKSYVADGSFSDKFGARNMARFISREIEDRIADILFADRNVSGISIDCADNKLKFDII